MTDEKTAEQKSEQKAPDKKTSRKKTVKEKSTLEAAIVGRYCTFYGTISSGIETMDGVPMKVFADPDNRHIIELFSSDGARAYLYLDQVASFTTQPQAPKQGQSSEQLDLDMNRPPPTPMSAQGAEEEYYRPQQPGEAVDEVYYRSGRGKATPRRTERVSR